MQTMRIFGHAFVRSGLILALLVLVAGQLAADENLKIGFEGVRMLDGFIPTGADLSLTWTGWQFGAPADTKLFLKVGGGYEDRDLRRDTLSGNPVAVDATITYNALNFQWEAALIQGLTRRDDGGNALEAFVFYRGRWDSYENPDSLLDRFPDATGLFGTSLMAGLSLDTVATSSHRLKQGLYAEASVEWGPALLNARSDFWRASGKLAIFQPLFDLPNDGPNLFGAYLAGFASADYAAGAKVPIYVNTSFGGRKLRNSLGGSVRGYERSSYDSAFKAVANAELRLVGPALVIETIVPYLIGFLDAGYYHGFNGASADFVAPGSTDASGTILSTGAALAIDLFGAAQLGATIGLKLSDDALYNPDKTAFWSIMVALHF
jgi:hypothetical protein